MSANKTVRTPWSSDEDNALMELVRKHGTLGSWPTIAQGMHSRTGKQCRERYINHLDPTIRKANWTREEDNIIREMHAKVGSQWSQYVPLLPGRTDNTIKNRYHVISRFSLDRITQPALKRLKSETSTTTETSTCIGSCESASSAQNQIKSQITQKIDVLKSLRDRINSEIVSLTNHISSGNTGPHVNSVAEDVPGNEDLPPTDLDAFDFDWGELNTSALTYEQIDTADLKQLLGTVFGKNEDGK